MENLNAITTFFAQIWQIFTIQHPVIGIPFSVIYLGIFAISFSVLILKPILGIGYGAVGDISSGARSAYRKSRQNSYRTYEKKRSRAEEYSKRYERR